MEINIFFIMKVKKNVFMEINIFLPWNRYFFIDENKLNFVDENEFNFADEIELFSMALTRARILAIESSWSDSVPIKDMQIPPPP